MSQNDRNERLINNERFSYSIADREEKTRILNKLQRETGLSRSALSQRLNQPTKYKTTGKKDQTDKSKRAAELVSQHLSAARNQASKSSASDNVESGPTLKNMYTKVVGVTQPNEDGRPRQEIISDEIYNGMDLFLERDYENDYDPNAIAVLTSVYGETIGYLSRDIAAQLAPLMDNGQLITAVVADLTGGEEGKENLGVNLFLTILSKEETEAAARRSAARYQATSPAKPSDGFTSVPTFAPIPTNTPGQQEKKNNRPNPLVWWRGLSKRTRTWIIVIAILVLAALCNALTSCAPKEVIVVHTQEVPVTQIVEVTRQIEITELVIVTATPVPPTPTPVFQKWSPGQVQDTILAAGLEFVDPKKMEPKDYGLAPYNAVEGWRFLIPSLCYDCGGRVYTFDSPGKLAEMKRYYDSLGESSAAFFSWTFARDNILIQINGDLPEAQALLYQQALESMQ